MGAHQLHHLRLHHLLALIGLWLLMCGSAWATITPTGGYGLGPRGTTINSIYFTCADGCFAPLRSQVCALAQAGRFSSETRVEGSGDWGACEVRQGTSAALSTWPFVTFANQCPANSTLSGSVCVCKTGFVESGGACLSNEQALAAECAALSGQSAGETTWAGDSAEFYSCDGYRTQGAGRCVMKASSDIGWKDPSTGKWYTQGRAVYTGTIATSCTGSGGSGTTPGGSTAGGGEGTGKLPADNTSAPAPCPAGQAPGQYNGQTICAPMGSDTPTKAPAPSSGSINEVNADGTSKQVTTNGTTTCTNGKCETVSTVTTTTKNAQGTVTSTDTKTTTTSQSQTTFCQANGKAAQCAGEGDGKGGEFGGDCTAGFRATGDDPILNAMALEQYKRNCTLFGNDPDANSTAALAKSGADGKNTDKLKSDASAAPVTISTFDATGRGWARACPADPTFTLSWAGGRSFALPFSRVCTPLQLLSLAAVSLTMLGCFVWVVGGKQ